MSGQELAAKLIKSKMKAKKTKGSGQSVEFQHKSDVKAVESEIARRKQQKKAPEYKIKKDKARTGVVSLSISLAGERVGMIGGNRTREGIRIDNINIEEGHRRKG